MATEEANFPRLVGIEDLEARYPTIDNLQDRFDEIFGNRDAIYLDDRYKRIRFYQTGVAGFLDYLRHDPTPRQLEMPMARIVSRIFCIANSFRDVYVSDGMMMKYPLDGCVYCHNIPCVCQADRGDAELSSDTASEQVDWSLRDWQNHLGDLYGEPNAEKGIWFVATRLVVENDELVTAEDAVSRSTQDEVRTTYSLELADTLAWTIAAANICEVDLLSATLDRFGAGCGYCGQLPCACGPHNMQQVKF